MAQEYTVANVQVGDAKDQHGNSWVALHFEGVAESASALMKNIPEVGQRLYGSITTETSKAGKQYKRFRREQRPENEGGVQSNWTSTKDLMGKAAESASKTDSINRAVALKAAVEGKYSDEPEKTIEVAKYFLEWLNGDLDKTNVEKVQDVIPGAEEVDGVDINDLSFDN